MRTLTVKGTVAWDFWSGFFSRINRPWVMIKVPIFSFLIFGDFNELLPNSVLLAAYIDAASKKSVLRWPSNFFKNHNSIQVHMVDELFLSINLVLTAVKLFNIGNLTLFSSQFTFPIFDAGSKIQILCWAQFFSS